MGSPYPDVQTTHWSFPFIEYITNAHIMGGTTNGTFEPSKNITRAEISVIVANLLGKKGIYAYKGNLKKFPDVSLDYWAHSYIDITTSNGIMGGFPDGTFRPSDSITRAEMAVVSANLLKFLDGAYSTYSNVKGALQRYSDVPVSYWGFNYIEITWKANVMRGTSGPDGNPVFKCDDLFTRAEAATVASNILGKI